MPFVIIFNDGPVTGKIDRLCELSDGVWIVIDYKSEASSDYAAVAEEYAFSLSGYVEAARHPTRGKCMKGVIYFTETGEFGIISSS